MDKLQQDNEYTQLIKNICGQMCKLETLCKKVTFSVIRTFVPLNPQKKATAQIVIR